MLMFNTLKDEQAQKIMQQINTSITKINETFNLAKQYFTYNK